MKARILHVLALVIVSNIGGRSTALAVAPASVPSTTVGKVTLEQITRNYFATKPDFRPSDLISRADAEKVLKMATDEGLAFQQETENVVERIPGPEAFLQQYFATRAGKAFIRKSATDAQAYEALERVAAQPDGKDLVRQLANEKGGSKLITYLSSTKGGQRLQSGLKPTGRKKREPAIYTAKQLFQELKKIQQ